MSGAERELMIPKTMTALRNALADFDFQFGILEERIQPICNTFQNTTKAEVIPEGLNVKDGCPLLAEDIERCEGVIQTLTVRMVRLINRLEL